MRFWSASREHLFGHPLPHEGQWLVWKRLCPSKLLSVNTIGRNFSILEGENRLAGLALEDQHMTRFCNLCHSIEHAPISIDRDQSRRGWKIAIPDIVLDRLKMPFALARGGIQTEQRICE